MKILISLLRPTRLVTLVFLLGAPLHAQFAITAHTTSGGSGTSSGGSFGLQGTAGQPEASVSHSGGVFDMAGGFWNSLGSDPIEAFANWAVANIPSGLDATFGGDFDGDEIPNGLSYVFGPDNAQLLSEYPPTAPPMDVPADVTLFLETNTSPGESGWTEVLRYEGGVQVYIHPNATIADGSVHDDNDDTRRFYRYRVVLTP